tara:strand:+ start:1131 stop:2099 length:969 start_codon:yes stop_codon:yes gene_type:complete
MGWRGTVRSIQAAARRAERESERRYKAMQKEAIAADAAEAVASWTEHIENLKSLHHEIPRYLDWKAIAEVPPPREPAPDISSTRDAKAQLDAFKPKLLDRLRRGGSQRRRQRLVEAVEQAKEIDRARHRKKIEVYRKAYADWQSDRDMARKLLDRDPETLLAVIQENHSLTDAGLIGEQIRFRIDSDVGIHAILTTHGTDVVPDFRRKQLASGKLSETKMPRAEFNEIYQDYVASAAYRVAGELLSILPIDEVYVTCTSEMLNSTSGHLEYVPILSVRFVRATFEQLNLNRIDPSDALSNFVHVMSFKRTTGFSSIIPLVEM